MRWKLVALVFFGIIAVMQAAWAENIAVKAATPVHVSIYPEASVVAGSLSTFVVRATSILPSENFVIEVLPGQGSRWISGQQRWQGAIVPGQVQEFRFTVQMPITGIPAISVTASIQADDGTQLAASAAYRQQKISPIAAQKSNTVRKVSREGRPVVEYRVR
jgi:hypothetical protein